MMLCRDKEASVSYIMDLPASKLTTMVEELKLRNVEADRLKGLAVNWNSMSFHSGDPSAQFYPVFLPSASVDGRMCEQRAYK